MLFTDRHDAGRQLAQKLQRYAGHKDVFVLALPRGGVPVGWEVAQALRAPLDVFLVRKLGMPGHEEFAIGAIASGGVCVRNDAVGRYVTLSKEAIDRIAAQEERELARREKLCREKLYRGERRLPDLRGKIVILVDDGLATGSSMRAAVTALRPHEPGRIVVAVPVGAEETCATFRTEADEVVCARMPEPFLAVGMCYENFSQTTDEEVRALLNGAGSRVHVPQRHPPPSGPTQAMHEPEHFGVRRF